MPTFTSLPSINQSEFREVTNFFSSSEVSKLVNFLLGKYGQSLNYFMKLVQVQSQPLASNSGNLKRSLYKLVFEIRRYENLSQEGMALSQGVLKYEIVFEYNVTQSTNNVSI